MATSLIHVVLPGKGPITLRPSDHIATGGEGAVYLKNNLIFKLFLDPAQAQANAMADKIKMLAQIRHPFIVSPIDVLLDSQHQVVGYYMEQAPGVPLMKTFTNSWRDLNAFTDAQSVKLVENMREAVLAAHALNAVIVDGNETNYLAHGVEPRIIDVDSWQIGKHRATALMPSIRDYHSKTYTALTDWFAWGIVSFQVFTGLHPYKGTHPAFKRGDLEARMRANASVFDKQVRLNTAVRDFACVPKPLLDWYEGVFAQGERSAPPSALTSQSAPKLTKKVRIRQSASGSVRHDRVRSLGGVIRHVSGNGVAFYTDTEGLKAFDLYRQQAIPALSSVEIEQLFANQAGLLRHGDSFVYVYQAANALQGRIVPAERDPRPASPLTNLLPLSTPKLVTMGNRLFALNPQVDNGLVELDLLAMGSRTVLAVKASWPVNVQSTRFHDGVAVMDCLGTPFLAIPEPGTLFIQKAAALAAYKVVNAFSRPGRYVWAHGVRRSDGQLYRLELRSTGAAFELVRATVVDDAELNLAVTAKGVAVGILEDALVTVINTAGSGEKEVSDPSVTKEMRLFALPEGVHYFLGQDIYKLSLT